MFRLNNNRLGLLVALPVLIGGCSGSLSAQIPPTWAPIDPAVAGSSAVGYKVLLGPDGYQVFFKNFGRGTVHFGFFIDGAQTADAAPANGRVHLKPRGQSGALIIPGPSDQKGSFRVRVVEFVIGEEDAPSSN